MFRRTSALATLTLTSTLALGACSMPGESSTPSESTAPAGSKTVSINGQTIDIPKGYTLYSDVVDGSTKTVVLVNGKKMPTNINVAKNPTGFEVKTWCDDMEKMLKQNFAPGAKITVSMTPKNDPTECRIVGHGKTGTAGTTASNTATPSGTSKSGAPASSSSSPSASSTSSESANVIAPGTPYSITTNVKKASNGAYVALMSRQLDEKYDFADELALFDKISK